MSTNNYRKCVKCGRIRAEDMTVTYHRFPYPGPTNIVKARAWATYCWPNQDWTSVEKLQSLCTSSKVLCGRHFNSIQFYDNNRQKLSKFAVPDSIEVDELLNERENVFYEIVDQSSVTGQHNILRKPHSQIDNIQTERSTSTVSTLQSSSALMDIEICRICLESNKLLHNLFEGPDSVKLSSISYKIMNLSNIQIYPNDGLPASICERCNQKLDECIEFISLCKKSDSKMRKREDNTQEEEENNSILVDDADECKNKHKLDIQDFRIGLTEADDDEIQSENKLKSIEVSSCDVLSEQKKLPQKQQCFTCGKVMSSSFRLKTHLATHLKEKQHSCTYCKKKFTIVENLNAHLRIHTGEKPYRCATCGETFAQSSGLIVHKRKHTGRMPYQCVLCPRSFQTIGNFKYHVRVHTGERNYNCSSCGRAFITSGDLKQHKAIHSGEKPHICSVCGTRFSRVSNLKRHVRYLHKEEKSFTCKHCSLKFLKKIDLTKHELYHKNK